MLLRPRLCRRPPGLPSPCPDAPGLPSPCRRPPGLPGSLVLLLRVPLPLSLVVVEKLIVRFLFGLPPGWLNSPSPVIAPATLLLRSMGESVSGMFRSCTPIPPRNDFNVRDTAAATLSGINSSADVGVLVSIVCFFPRMAWRASRNESGFFF